MASHKGTENTEKKQKGFTPFVFFAALCDIFYEPAQRHREHREKLCALCVLYGSVWYFFMASHKGTENTEKKQKGFTPFVFFAALCDIFYEPAQRHREHREKLCALCVLYGSVWYFFMASHKGTKITEKSFAPFVFFAALCEIFCLCVLCGFV